VRAWLFPLGLIALLAVAWSLRRRSRAPLAILLLFAGMLFPVLGFFDVYAFMFSFVADHWQYLPCLAVLAGAAALLARAPVPMRAAVVVALGLLTCWQSRMYANMETFYRATLVRNPACWMAHNNLGSLLRQRGRTAEALAHYETALQLKPDSAKAHDNTGVVLRQQHRLNEALHQFEQAVALDPGNAAFQNNLAGTLRETGHAAAALVHHRAAVRLDPEFGAAHNDYGITLRELGRPAEAIAEFEAALRIEPDSAPAHLNLMLSYWLLGRTAEARRHYTAARRLNPALPEVDLDHPPR
jgi:tetratricopeptide (TPR) repeat protein